MPDRIEPTVNPNPSNEPHSDRDFIDVTSTPKANKELRRRPEKVHQRCQNSDEGFCPHWRTCTLIHAKDRKHDEDSTHDKRMQARNGSTNQ